MQDPDRLLFVYGTLLSQIPSSMSKFLARRGELLGPATAEGTLIDVGRYPAFVVDRDGRTQGELYRLHADTLEESWQLLDAYEGVSGSEGDEYLRTTVDVRAADPTIERAQVYAYRPSGREKPVIPDGDYLAYYRANGEHRKFTGHT